MASDSFLVEEIINGNKLAFTVLYDKYHRELYMFAYKYVRDAEQAGDIVQHTFLKVWENRRRLNPASAIKSYLYSITKNHTLNVIRDYNTASARNEEYFGSGVYQTACDEQEEERIETLVLLHKAIESLPPQRMSISKMKIEEGLSNREIAEKMGISVNTVKVQYNLSIKQLRRMMGI